MRPLLSSLLILAIAASPLPAQDNALIQSANALLQREDLSDYRGWIKYLIFDATVVAKRPNIDEAKAQAKRERLENWIQTLSTKTDALEELRGPQEWAYESQADGSGQPFMINIPQDYDPARPTPVSLYMHGLAGNHSEHYTGSEDLRGIIELSVLGRSRGGSYIGLSEEDVLDVLDYVEAHWNVDPDRIHLLGGSMGGNGTFLLGSRYPHRFASARPTCGFASAKPWGNLLTLPFYAIHSDDDFVVPILHSRGPLDRLRESGGDVIYDQVTGYGHASWDYAEGNARAKQWSKNQVRPDSRSVRLLNYTAFDSKAIRSWWAEISMWGNKPKPAQFILKAGAQNTLYATLTNVDQLKLRIEESPFDPDQPLSVSINGAIPIQLSNPLPPAVFITRKDEAWTLETSTPQRAVRWHTPGGPNLLFDGEPLLIVYGTQGNAEENQAMLTAARIAAKSSNANWVGTPWGTAPDGFSHSHMLYGDLPIKPDSQLTPADSQRSHLILIGTARQNSAVAAIAQNLPVALSPEKIVFSDGETYPAKGLGLGLVHFNPHAPQNLIFWVASNDSQLYRENSPIPKQMYSATSGFNSVVAPGWDCLISAVDHESLVAARSFDNAWQWRPRNKVEPLLSPVLDSYQAWQTEVSKAILAESAADFAFTPSAPETDQTPFLPNATRLSDLVDCFLYEPIGIMTLNGATLLKMQAKLAAKGQSFYPVPTAQSIDETANYRVAAAEISLWDLVPSAEYAPTDYRLTDLQLSTAIERHFPTSLPPALTPPIAP